MIASIGIFSLYMLRNSLKTIMEAYVGFGTAFQLNLIVTELITSLILRYTGRERDGHWSTAEWNYSEWIGNFSFVDVASLAICFFLSTAWYTTRVWWLSDIIGVGISIAFMKIIQINKLWPALLLLSLLFIYDIFWVFFSPYLFKEGKSVMVEVAIAYDLPNKLIMPAL